MTGRYTDATRAALSALLAAAQPVIAAAAQRAVEERIAAFSAACDAAAAGEKAGAALAARLKTRQDEFTAALTAELTRLAALFNEPSAAAEKVDEDGDISTTQDSVAAAIAGLPAGATQLLPASAVASLNRMWTDAAAANTTAVVARTLDSARALVRTAKDRAIARLQASVAAACAGVSTREQADSAVAAFKASIAAAADALRQEAVKKGIPAAEVEAEAQAFAVATAPSADAVRERCDRLVGEARAAEEVRAAAAAAQAAADARMAPLMTSLLPWLQPRRRLAAAWARQTWTTAAQITRLSGQPRLNVTFPRARCCAARMRTTTTAASSCGPCPSLPGATSVTGRPCLASAR